MKRIFDIFISFCLIVFLFPLFVIIALLICATSSGSPLFIQNRIGLRGRVFKMYKFRTMYSNSEKRGTGLFSFHGDPRITRVGGILRRFSLDELPQLFNVLDGSMSLVGPRPPVTYELGDWNDYTPHMRKRFNVRPGITGLSQVSGRNDLNWDQKIVLDNAYVDRLNKHGFISDIPILVKTVLTVLSAQDTIETYAISTSDSSVAARAQASSSPETSSAYPDNIC